MGNKVLRLTEGKVNVSKMTKEELEEFRKKQEEMHLNFTNLIEQLNISSEEYRVLLVLGQNELVYSNGEFYIGETLDPDSNKKISREKAKDIFVDYYLDRNIKINKEKEEKEIKEKVEEKEIEEKVEEKDEKELEDKENTKENKEDKESKDKVNKNKDKAEMEIER